MIKKRDTAVCHQHNNQKKYSNHLCGQWTACTQGTGLDQELTLVAHPKLKGLMTKHHHLWRHKYGQMSFKMERWTGE